MKLTLKFLIKIIAIFKNNDFRQSNLVMFRRHIRVRNKNSRSIPNIPLLGKMHPHYQDF